MTPRTLKNFFFFMGFSLKTPVSLTMKSWFAVWSHIAFFLLSTSTVARTMQQLNLEFKYSFDALRAFTMLLIYTLTFISLTSIAGSRKKEALFWKCFELFWKTSKIFVVSRKPFIDWNATKLSICFLTIFLPMFRVFFLDSQRSDEKVFPFMSLILIHVMIIRASLLKIIYLSGKLEMCIKHLELLLIYRTIPIQGSSHFKKLWKTCWQMNRLIEDIGGLPLLLLVGLVIAGSINNCYTAFLGLSKGKLETGGILSVVVMGIEICITSKSCHNCFKYYRSIKGLVHKMYGEIKTESFALQLMHQTILFAPKQMFEIDHMFVVSVSA